MSALILIRHWHVVRIMLVSGFVLLWIAAPFKTARADEIRLNTGLTVEGTIVHEDEEHVVVDIPNVGQISLPQERVESYEKNTPNIPFSIPLPKEIVDTVSWERLSGRLSGIRDRLQKAYADVGSFMRSRAKLRAVSPNNLADKETSDSAKTDERLPIATVGLIMAACLLLHGYVSFCLQRLAGCLRISHGWTAWVPMLQGILWLRIGGRSFLWLLIPIGLSFVDTRAAELGWFVLGLVSMLSVVHQCQRSPWLALLLCVPGLNLIALGHLAFSQER